METMIVASAAMQLVLARACEYARSTAPVLLLGESGVGKEVVARRIHAESGRNGRFVAINCGAIPEALLESELFGHTKGAFTDASRAKPGLFEEADRGTLFLDELGDLPLAVQVKLLRVLQEGEVRRVGDLQTRSVDVRIIAATNAPLEDLLAQKRFREDLYYRVNVLRLEIPPLRERQEDIGAIARHILRHAHRPLTLEPDAITELERHTWPGNVRELANICSRLEARLIARPGLGCCIDAALAHEAIHGAPLPDEGDDDQADARAVEPDPTNVADLTAALDAMSDDAVLDILCDVVQRRRLAGDIQRFVRFVRLRHIFGTETWWSIRQAADATSRGTSTIERDVAEWISLRLVRNRPSERKILYLFTRA